MSPAGPEAFRDHQLYRINTELQHRFSERYSLRVAANYSNSERVDRRHQNTGLFTRTESGVLVPDRINWAATNDDNTFDAWVFQGDLVARFEYLGAKHQAIFGAEFIDQKEVRIRDNTLAGTAPGRIPPYIFGAADQPGWRIGDRALYTTPNQRLVAPAERRAVSLTNLWSMAQERVHVLAGIRLDEGDLVNENALGTTPLDRRQEIAEKADSITVGAVWRPVPSLSLYVSSSESFSGVPASSQDPFGRALTEPVSGESLEAGLKGSLFKDKLSFSLAVFEIEQLNERRQVSMQEMQEIIDLGLDPAVVSGARFFQDASSEAKGADIEVLWRPTASYQVQATYTHVEAVVTENRQFPILVGRPPNNTPGENFGSLFHKYEFGSGPLKGLALTNGVILRDNKRPFSTSTATGVTTFVPSYTRWDAGVSYRTKRFGAQTPRSPCGCRT
jgi:outer membrane receptor for ferric coprogen and ferric-rhodotorulic acid